MSKAQTGKSITYTDGAWVEGNPKLLGAMDHGVWLGSAVFDGARAFGGMAPDLDLHCARAVRSAQLMGMAPDITGPEIEAIARDGIARFDAELELYVCPMFYPTDGFIVPDPATTHFVLTISEAPIPAPDGFSACISSFRRPGKDQAPTEAKAACLYPNVARAVAEARDTGFDTAVMPDPDGLVAEFAYANLFMVKDGAAHTPAINGTFLNGITRQRVIALLQEDGIAITERSITFDELKDADEIFGSGNYYKVAPCTRFGDRNLQAGPVYRRARELYFDFAKNG